MTMLCIGSNIILNTVMHLLVFLPHFETFLFIMSTFSINILRVKVQGA